jgi:hypothetical protein
VQVADYFAIASPRPMWGSIVGKGLRLSEKAGDSLGSLRGVGGGDEDLPDAVDPVEVLGLHEDGAKAG